MTTLLGIVLGLSAAFSQCFAYLVSRAFVVRHRHAFVGLLLTSHLYMGVMALVVLVAARSPAMPPAGQYARALTGATLAYMLGQGAMLLLMRHTNPSRVAPLLGAKIIILAILATTFFGYSLSPIQIVAVAACAAAVVLINYSGVSLTLPAALILLVACTGYSLSDLHIHALIVGLQPLSPLRAAVVGGALSYVLCGVISLLLLPWLVRYRMVVDWRYALPFSVFWYAAMLGLFASIGYVGPIFGVILQSSRGLMSIVIGVFVARLGWLHIEQQHAPRVWIKRGAAAVLMSLAITLYAVGTR